MTTERAAFRAHRDLGIEHISATYERHRFPPHCHNDYLIGLTIAGAESFRQDGSEFVSKPGQVRTINPGVVHEGGCGAGGIWQYEALYIPVGLMLEAALAVRNVSSMPRLDGPVLDDFLLSGALRKLFAGLTEEIEPLAREVSLAGFLQRIAHNRILHTDEITPGPEPLAVARVRDYLRDHLSDRITLDRLAAVSDLSKFHLLRVFKAQTGLTPWQFQMQSRVDHAKRLLARGDAPAHVAASCGFSDQSHLTKRFRQLVGVTPAAFAADVRCARRAR